METENELLRKKCETLHDENEKLKREIGFFQRLYLKASAPRREKARQQIAEGKYWTLHPDGTKTPGPGIDISIIEEMEVMVEQSKKEAEIDILKRRGGEAK